MVLSSQTFITCLLITAQPIPNSQPIDIGNIIQSCVKSRRSIETYNITAETRLIKNTGKITTDLTKTFVFIADKDHLLIKSKTVDTQSGKVIGSHTICKGCIKDKIVWVDSINDAARAGPSEQPVGSFKEMLIDIRGISFAFRPIENLVDKDLYGLLGNPLYDLGTANYHQEQPNIIQITKTMKKGEGTLKILVDSKADYSIKEMTFTENNKTIYAIKCDYNESVNGKWFPIKVQRTHDDGGVQISEVTNFKINSINQQIDKSNFSPLAVGLQKDRLVSDIDDRMKITNKQFDGEKLVPIQPPKPVKTGKQESITKSPYYLMGGALFCFFCGSIAIAMRRKHSS